MGMSQIRSAFSEIPDDRWEMAFGKKTLEEANELYLVDSSNGKTLVSKTEVVGSSPTQSALKDYGRDT